MWTASLTGNINYMFSSIVKRGLKQTKFVPILPPALKTFVQKTLNSYYAFLLTAVSQSKKLVCHKLYWFIGRLKDH